MGHQHQMLDDPFSSISSLEADIFSCGGTHTQWPGFDIENGGIPALAPAANNASASSRARSTPGGGGGELSHRKISHNAYERDRRKQLNGLYSSLRSLIPDTDHTKKLSIPITVTQVLKYIPELQKEVANLEKKKEELTRASCKAVLLGKTGNMATIVSATCLDDRDVMVQVSLASNMAGPLPMSKCIKLLENEGLRLISSSISMFQSRTLYSLHLQRTQRTMSKVCRELCDELENAIKKKAGIRQQQ